MQKLRGIVQVIFLIIFVSLMILGKAQFWMAFVFASIFLSAFIGRWYCGWACPINTLMRPVNWLAKLLGTNRATPLRLKNPLYRGVVLGVFLIGLGYTIYTITQGRKFPLPLIVIPIGLVVTLLINENAWHRYLCPWGTLFSFFSRFAIFRLKVKECRSCGVCVRQCVTEAIVVSNGGAQIDPTNCLLCYQCQTSCPTKTIKYAAK